MAKPEKRAMARKLRKQGMSILAIAKKVGAAKSSVSGWCQDIQLAPEQEKALQKSNARREAQVKGARANVIKHRKKRRKYQEEGRQKAHEGDPLHLAGCMLYWAEGAKGRNEIKFVNSDADMLVRFIKFMRENLQILDDKIKVRIYAFRGAGSKNAVPTKQPQIVKERCIYFALRDIFILTLATQTPIISACFRAISSIGRAIGLHPIGLGVQIPHRP